MPVLSAKHIAHPDFDATLKRRNDVMICDFERGAMSCDSLAGGNSMSRDTGDTRSIHLTHTQHGTKSR